MSDEARASEYDRVRRTIDYHSTVCSASVLAHEIYELKAALMRCIQALEANGAPNCEAVKEARAALISADEPRKALAANERARKGE